MKKFLACLTALVLVLAPAAQAAQLPFTDVKPAEWYYDAVAEAFEMGLIHGTSATTFEPGVVIDRAMAVTVLYRFAGEPEPTTTVSYRDVPPSRWYSKAVVWATEQGIAKGYGDGTFQPNRAISREELAVLFYHFQQVIRGVPTGAAATLSFTDASSTASWAMAGVKWCVGNGIITGQPGNRLDPKGSATRAQLAAMLARFPPLNG